MPQHRLQEISGDVRGGDSLAAKRLNSRAVGLGPAFGVTVEQVECLDLSQPEHALCFSPDRPRAPWCSLNDRRMVPDEYSVAYRRNSRDRKREHSTDRDHCAQEASAVHAAPPPLGSAGSSIRSRHSACANSLRKLHMIRHERIHE